MPIRQPVFDPPFNVVRASHIDYGVTDLPRAKAYWADALGYLVAGETRTRSIYAASRSATTIRSPC
jgi:catechol 2,3-dioxygenase